VEEAAEVEEETDAVDSEITEVALEKTLISSSLSASLLLCPKSSPLGFMT